MRKVSVQLTKPVIELVLKAKDIAGESAELTVGFKRKTIAEANALIALCDKVTNGVVGTDLNLPPEIQTFVSAESKEEALKALVKNEILYLKNVELTLEATKEEAALQMLIEDTRTVENNEELWGDSSRCLDFLLDIYLTSAPWSSAFISAIYSISLNLEFGSNAEVKNL